MQIIDSYIYNNKELSTNLDKIDPAQSYHVLLIPDCSFKDRIQLIGGLFAQMLANVSLNRKYYDDKNTEQQLLLQHAEAMRVIGLFLGYFLNSRSFKDCENHSWDVTTLTNRLEIIKKLLQ